LALQLRCVIELPAVLCSDDGWFGSLQHAPMYVCFLKAWQGRKREREKERKKERKKEML
jgi:hypothetical protein